MTPKSRANRIVLKKINLSAAYSLKAIPFSNRISRLHQLQEGRSRLK
jgi:hypothetical protein